MNIIEAVKSGRPFRRRRIGEDWLGPTDSPIVLGYESLLADDWELKPRKVKKTGWVRRKDIESYRSMYNDALGEKLVEVTWEEEE